MLDPAQDALSCCFYEFGFCVFRIGRADFYGDLSALSQMNLSIKDDDVASATCVLTYLVDMQMHHSGA